MIRPLTRRALPALAALALAAVTIVPHSPAASAGFDDLFTLEYEKNVVVTYPVGEPFSGISVDTTDSHADVRLRPSTDGTVSVVSNDLETASYTVGVENGVLTVSCRSTALPEVGFHILHGTVGSTEPRELTVYLPAGDYGSLDISTDFGDIEVPADFNFSAASLDTHYGDIRLSGSVTGALACDTGYGEIRLDGPLAGSVEIDSAYGEVELQNLTTQSVRVDTSYGDIDLNGLKVSSDVRIDSRYGEVGLEQVSAAGTVRVETNSGSVDLEGTTAGRIEIETDGGDIDLERSDAASLLLSASRGDIEASLLTAKNFQTDTGSDRVQVSGHDPAAGVCELRTTSGSITASVRP